jgi:hypothetical protein
MTKVSVQSPSPNTAPVRISLSANGLANITYRDEINDFEFIVGEDRYQCPWFIAHFLSHRIAAIHEIDNTICSFRVETLDVEGEFRKIISLCRGETIMIDWMNREFYAALGEELENEELFSFSRFGKCEELDRDIVLNRLEHLHRMKFDCSNEIKFIASHFHEIDISRLEKFEPSSVERILSSNELVNKSEDWIYETIWRFVENDRMNFAMIQFIRFEFVSKSIATRFISTGSDFVDLIDSSIWMSLGRRFIDGFSNDQSNCRFLHAERTFSPSGK